MKKTIATVMLSLIIVGSMTGCAANNKVENTVKPTPIEQQKPVNQDKPSIKDTINMKEVMKDIEDNLTLPGLIDGTDAELLNNYGIDPSIVSNYIIKLPMMNVTATEFAIFEAKTDADVDAIKKGIAKRIESLDNTWKQYLPDQYELVKNNKVLVNGKYVFFIVSEKSDYSKNAFDRAFDSTIEKMIIPTEFKNIEAVVTESNGDTFTVETKHKERTFKIKVSKSEEFYFEGENKTVAVGDNLRLVFSEPIIEDLKNPEAVLAGKASYVEKFNPAEQGEVVNLDGTPAPAVAK